MFGVTKLALVSLLLLLLLPPALCSCIPPPASISFPLVL